MSNQLKTVLLLGLLSVLLVGIGGAAAPGMMHFFLFLAVLMNIGSYFYSDKIVLKMQRARPLSENEAPELHAMVRELAHNAQIPMPRLYIIPEQQPNAFATGRNPENGVVAVTEGIMRILDERELRGVIAHELAHIKNRDILIASIGAMMATAISYIANVLQFTAFFGGGRSDDEGGSPVAALAMAFIAPIAATFIQMSISRSREYIADRTGAQISGDPEGLARALAKLHMGAQRIPAQVQPATASLFIVSPFAGGGMQKMFSTHPPMEERIAKLRAMRMVAAH